MGPPDDRTGETPAVDPIAYTDAPRGFAGASWWPITTAVGVVVFVVGVGIFLVGSRVPAIVDAGLGPGVSFVGGLVALAGVSGWFYQAYLKQYDPDVTDPPEDKYLWGMLLYMPIELALFGAALLYFAFVYYGSWPPGELAPMMTLPVWIMTTVIVVSSFTNYFAGRALYRGNERRFLVLLGTTPILGGIYLAGKAWNWHRLIVQEGVWIDSGFYWSVLFSSSGLHALLVIAGIVMILVVLARGLAGHYSPEQHVSVSTTNMYWWMVDSIWLVLVVELYATVAICRAGVTC